MLKTKKYNIAAALIAIILLMTVMPFKTASAAAVTASVDAPSEIAQNTTFTATINVSTVTNLKSWEMQVTYDASVIIITGQEGITGVKSGKIGTVESHVNSWNYLTPSVQGTVVAKGQLISAVSGEGSLAQITFKATGSLGSKSEIKIASLKLTDSSNTSVQANGGTKTVTLIKAATTTPSSSKTTTTTATTTPSTSTPTPTSTGKTATPSSSTTKPSTTASGTATSTPITKITIAVPPSVQMLEEFIIRIDIEKATDLDSFHFVLEYDPEVLEVRNVTPGMIGSTGVEISEWTLTPPETQGKVEVMGAIPGGKGVNGAGFLAKIHCQMIGEMGTKSNLTLAETELTNLAGNALELERIDVKTIEVESTRVSISVPEEIPPDGKFEAVVDISQVNDMTSYSLNLVYNESVLEVIEVNPGLIGTTRIPVDDWDFASPDKQGKIYIKGALDEDSEGVSGIGYLARIQCRAIGRVSQRSKLALENIELLNVDGEPILQSPPENGSVVIASSSFLSSTLGLVIVIVAALVVIGLVLFFVLRIMRRRRKTNPGKPAPPAGKAKQVENPDDLMEVMRSRISQLPSRKGGRKTDSNDDQPK